jgi:hypothetical protein
MTQCLEHGTPTVEIRYNLDVETSWKTYCPENWKIREKLKVLFSIIDSKN